MLPLVTGCWGEPLVNVLGAAQLRDYEPDFCWPGRRWIVEIDGDHHLDPAIRARDEERDARLRASGWIIVRVPWRIAYHEPDLALSIIRDAFDGRIDAGRYRESQTVLAGRALDAR